MTDQKNTLLFIALSAIILIGWQIFFGVPQMEKQKQQQSPATTTTAPPTTTTPQAPTEATAPTLTREQALAQSPRIALSTPRVSGSLALRGGRIDDLSLTH